MICATPLNTRIFAGDLQFGEFHAILRGVVVKKIHNSSGSVEKKQNAEMRRAQL
jgi:hypothetical protein